MTLDYKKIKRIRKERGLTQKELANLSGLSFSAVNKVENGERTEPSFITLYKISNVLGVDPKEFIIIN